MVIDSRDGTTVSDAKGGIVGKKSVGQRIDILFGSTTKAVTDSCGVFEHTSIRGEEHYRLTEKAVAITNREIVIGTPITQQVLQEVTKGYGTIGI